ncbi:MAG: M14 family zinc carboxypeptidase [Candidatus Zixiibacteriota bacterium]
MKIGVVLWCLLPIWIAAGAAFGGDETISQVNIYYSSDDQLLDLLSQPLDVIGRGDGYIESFVSRKQLDELQTSGYHIEVVYEDVVEFYKSRLASKPMGAYKTLSEINDYVDTLISHHPDLLSQKISIGTTYEGRDIWAFKLSDNPNVDEDEPEILYTACIHAREVITPEVLFYFIEYMIDHYTTLPSMANVVNNTQMWFVPVVNPDGYYHNEVIAPNGGGIWRKNRKPTWDGDIGVDLNRNYGYGWAWDDYGSASDRYDYTYRGPKPFSEEETRALRDFAYSHNFAVSLYVHSKGNYFMYPWGYIMGATSDDALFAAFGDSISAYNGYTTGREYGTIYPINGGAQDWHYAEIEKKRRTAAFILEVGSQADGFWPPVERIDPLVQENLMTCLILARNASNLQVMQGPNTPALAVSDSSSALEYVISWSASNDPINPAIDYQLEERSNSRIGTDRGNTINNWDSHLFSISINDYVSSPSSFYSGTGDLKYKYFQSFIPYHVQPGDTLRFNAKYDIEPDYDFAYVEVSFDGSDFWSIPGNITTDHNVYGNNQGYGITGKSYLEEWVEAKFDLSAYEGLDIYIRFTYQTDVNTEGYGIYIDDIRPALLWDAVTTYSTGGSTSMTFTDKPERIYHYRVKAKDAESDWGMFSAFASTTVWQGYICGDANGDRGINIGDAVFLIAHIFKGGAAPDPIEAGDANCDGNLNIGDAVYLVSHIFMGGPAPCCPE